MGKDTFYGTKFYFVPNSVVSSHVHKLICGKFQSINKIDIFEQSSKHINSNIMEREVNIGKLVSKKTMKLYSNSCLNIYSQKTVKLPTYNFVPADP